MSDDPLETALRDALLAEVPVRRGPSPERIAALRQAAEEQRAAAEEPRGVAAPQPVSAARQPGAVPAIPAASSSRWARRVLVAAAVLVAFLCGALITSDPPGPVRDVAHGVGLGVESRDLVRARDRMQELGEALAVATDRKVQDRLTDAELEAVAAADRDMLLAVARLDEDERVVFVPTAHQVHLRAVALFVAEGRDLATAQPRDLEELGAGS